MGDTVGTSHSDYILSFSVVTVEQVTSAGYVECATSAYQRMALATVQLTQREDLANDWLLPAAMVAVLSVPDPGFFFIISESLLPDKQQQRPNDKAFLPTVLLFF